ncbi:hypothetical protein [Pseudactinotalea sp.]|uniref:hypothetical protein n=1 Tax=Pseudactinotalea sp. TaxID=1926260 RepID=UPI003B3B0B3E
MRSLRAVAVGVIAALALGSIVISSAAGLGGLHTQHLGGASASVQALEGTTLTWSPQWRDGGWQVGGVTVTADPARGFLAGDHARLTIAGTDTCELTTTLDAPAATIAFTSGTLTAACGRLPALTSATSAALVVTGADGSTQVSNIGSVTGSIAGFSGAVTATGEARATTANRVITSVVVDVPGISAHQLTGATLTIATTGHEPVTTSVSNAVGHGDGARVTIDVTDQAWTTTTARQVDLALSTPQRLGASAAVVLARTTTSAEAPATPGGPGGNEPGSGGDTGDNPGTTTPPATGGNGLQPTKVSPGIAYSYRTPWTGVQTNNLTFCHEFTVTNTTRRTLGDWTVTFDTRLAPMWGMDPTQAGTVRLSNIETRSYGRGNGAWTVGGNSDWARSLQAGESRTVSFCATSVPTPTPDPSLYNVTVSVVSQGDWYVTFRVKVTSTSEFYVPWRAEVDLADLVCGASLTGKPLTFSQVTATPVAGSSTAYVLQGTTGDTQLVSASHSRDVVFATYSPGPGWQSCGQ